MWPVLRLCHKLRIDMAHFCTDLQTYIASRSCRWVYCWPLWAQAAVQSQGQPPLGVAVAEA